MDEDGICKIESELSPQQGAREAGGTATAVNAYFAAREGANVEPCLAQFGICLLIFLNRQQAIVPQREYIARQRVTFGVVDFNEAVSARLEQFDCFHC